MDKYPLLSTQKRLYLSYLLDQSSKKNVLNSCAELSDNISVPQLQNVIYQVFNVNPLLHSHIVYTSEGIFLKKVIITILKLGGNKTIVAKTFSKNIGDSRQATQMVGGTVFKGEIFYDHFIFCFI